MASQGANNPGTMADDAAVGATAWSNPDNAKTSNDTNAMCTSQTTSHYLKATNFGFSIPAGATINGIIVEIERRQTVFSGNCKDVNVRIVKADESIGTENKADTATNWPNTDTYKSYGAVDNLWSESWAYTDINDIHFGVVLSTAQSGPGSPAPYVDHIRITVYYTEGAGAPSTQAYINIGDSLKNISQMYINIGDAWKNVSAMYINIGDAWKTVIP